MIRKIAQQGEVAIYKLDEMPFGLQSKPVEKTNRGDFIISHSETGNHHVISGDANVIERTNGVPDGMRKLYALLDKPDSLRQDAPGNAHGSIELEAGAYLFKISREYDPFIQQARIVAD